MPFHWLLDAFTRFLVVFHGFDLFFEMFSVVFQWCSSVLVALRALEVKTQGSLSLSSSCLAP